MLLLILMHLLVILLTGQLLFSSRSKLVDGSEVIQEIHAKPKTSLASGPAAGMVGQNMDLNANKPGLEPPSQGNSALTCVCLLHLRTAQRRKLKPFWLEPNSNLLG